MPSFYPLAIGENQQVLYKEIEDWDVIFVILINVKELNPPLNKDIQNIPQHKIEFCAEYRFS